MSSKPEFIPFASNQQRRAALENSDLSGEVFEQKLISPNLPDELAMALERVSDAVEGRTRVAERLARKAGKRGLSKSDAGAMTVTVGFTDLRLILSRLASQEDDYKALLQWADKMIVEAQAAELVAVTRAEAQEETIRADGEALKDGIDKLGRASHDLAEAADMLESWGAYASPEMREKHDFDTDYQRVILAANEAKYARARLSARQEAGLG